MQRLLRVEKKILLDNHVGMRKVRVRLLSFYHPE